MPTLFPFTFDSTQFSRKHYMMAPRAAKNTSQKSEKSQASQKSSSQSSVSIEDVLKQLCEEIPVAAKKKGDIK
jgi:hypothetical protein